MNNKAKTFLILCCIFVTIALAFSIFDGYLSFGTYALLFSNPDNLGEALGVIFGAIVLVAMTILLGFGVVVFGGLTIGFVIPLIKIQGKKWYAIVLLVSAIVMIGLAILYIAMLPVVSDAHEAAKAASSSSSSSSAAPAPDSSALLFF